MRKYLVLSILGALMVSTMPVSASAHDGWRGDDDHEEWHEHHWHDRDDDWRERHWHHARYEQPVYEVPAYYYQPQPVYIAPRPVYVQPQPVLSFFFGR